MSTQMVLGIGNALTDVWVSVSDEKLVKFDLPKGSMQLVGDRRNRQLFAAISAQGRSAGGCAANTICGLGELGVRTAFIGKVGKDEIGAFFERDLQSHGVESRLIGSGSPSGTALTFSTPDKERTFATFLGAAAELAAGDLQPAMFAGADYLHIEGYLVQNHSLIATAIDMAKAAGATVSIDLASYNVVEEHLAFLRGLLDKGLDIVFANEREAQAFTGLPEERALERLAEICRIAVVKLGERGSLLARGSERAQVRSEPVAAVDTTGAGDLYATGFLYGLVNGRNLATCGRIATRVAREVIQVQGTKLDPPTWSRIQKALGAL